MKKIWYFGDSNTETYNLNYPYCAQYIEWKGYTPKHWTELLSEKMNLPYSNLGVGGCDNYTIFKAISDNIDFIGEHDIVIIGWTIPIRGRIANLDDNKWFTIVPMSNPNLKCITNDSILQMVSLRDSELYVEEVLDWQKIIKKALRSNTLVFWSYFPEFMNKGIMDSNYWKGQTNFLSINDETKGKIKDGHFGEIGNSIISNAMFNYIEKKLI